MPDKDEKETKMRGTHTTDSISKEIFKAKEEAIREAAEKAAKEAADRARTNKSKK